MNAKPVHGLCCSTAVLAEAATTRLSPWTLHRPPSPPTELPQPLLLRRPRQPPPSNQTRLLPTRPPSQPSDVNGDKDDHRSRRRKSDAETSSCSPTDVLRLMDALHLPVDNDLYLSLIKECTDSRDAVHSADLHAYISRARPGLLRRPTGLPFANRLLLMFASCDQSNTAHQLFDQMLHRDATSWAVIIASRSAEGCHGDALRMFVEMRERTGGSLPVLEPGVCWVHAVVSVLRSCTQARELGFGRQLHALCLKALGGGSAAAFNDLGSALIQFYSQLGYQENSVEVFQRACSLTTAAWTSMITSYCREGRFKDAICLFREMGRAGKRRNHYVFSSTLAACAKMRDDGWSGRQVHASAIKLGANSHTFVCSSLVDMYMKHELLIDGRRAFELPRGLRDYACWNALLMGYLQNGCDVEALKLLYEMKAAGIEPQEAAMHEVMLAL